MIILTLVFILSVTLCACVQVTTVDIVIIDIGAADIDVLSNPAVPTNIIHEKR